MSNKKIVLIYYNRGLLFADLDLKLVQHRRIHKFLKKGGGLQPIMTTHNDISPLFGPERGVAVMQP